MRGDSLAGRVFFFNIAVFWRQLSYLLTRLLCFQLPQTSLSSSAVLHRHNCWSFMRTGFPFMSFIATAVFRDALWRFGDERDEIIPIPALPLSRSNSLTKLSGSILAPAARENLVCHLQSTWGRTKVPLQPMSEASNRSLFSEVRNAFFSSACLSAFTSLPFLLGCLPLRGLLCLLRALRDKLPISLLFLWFNRFTTNYSSVHFCNQMRAVNRNNGNVPLYNMV